jgi:hypothetical protein
MIPASLGSVETKLACSIGASQESQRGCYQEAMGASSHSPKSLLPQLPFLKGTSCQYLSPINTAFPRRPREQEAAGGDPGSEIRDPARGFSGSPAAQQRQRPREPQGRWGRWSR